MKAGSKHGQPYTDEAILHGQLDLSISRTRVMPTRFMHEGNRSERRFVMDGQQGKGTFFLQRRSCSKECEVKSGRHVGWPARPPRLACHLRSPLPTRASAPRADLNPAACLGYAPWPGHSAMAWPQRSFCRVDMPGKWW